MSIKSLSPDVLSIVLSFLDNKNSSFLVCTCKTLKTYGDNHGFISSIKYNYNDDIIKFMIHFYHHLHTIKNIYIRGLDNPHLYITNYAENICFDHCNIYEYVNPKKPIFMAKSLKITDYHRYTNKRTLSINWSAFPNIENLELYVYDVDLSCLTTLKHLKTYTINTITNGKKIKL